MMYQTYQKFRFIKVELYDGSWKTYKPQNNLLRKMNFSKIKIQNEIYPLYNPPKNCYISVNKFVSYREHNPTYNYQNKPLFRYGLIDIDGQKFNSFLETKKYFIGILQFLKEHICIEEAVMTNSTVGGFQALVKNCCYDRFISLTKDFPEKFEYLDKLYDEKRVRRLPNTWNSNHNSMAMPLFLQGCLLSDHPQRSNNPESKSKDLNSSSPKILYNPVDCHLGSPLFPNDHSNGVGFDNHSFKECGSLENSPFHPPHTHSSNEEVPAVANEATAGFHTLGMPPEADDNEGWATTLPTVQNKGRESRIKSNGLCHHIKEVSSSVYSTNGNLIPILKMERLTKSSIKRLKRLQKVYKLGNLYIMGHSLGFDAFGLKCLDKRRLEKVLRKHGKGLLFFQKYHHQWLYLGKMIGCLRSEAKGQYSNPHSKFFNIPNPNLIGSDKLKVYTAVIGEGRYNKRGD